MPDGVKRYVDDAARAAEAGALARADAAIRRGHVTLIGGSAVVHVPLTRESNIQVSYATKVGVAGALSVPEATRDVAAGSFVIEGGNPTNNSTVDWCVIG